MPEFYRMRCTTAKQKERTKECEDRAVMVDHAIELRALSETPAIDMKRNLQRNQYTHIMAAQVNFFAQYIPLIFLCTSRS